MKTLRFLILMLMLSVPIWSGCDRIAFISDKPETNGDTITVTPVNDPQLAKLILKPSEKVVEIPRDPFKPLYSSSTSVIKPNKIEPIRDTFSDLYFIGMIKSDSKAIALLKIGNRKVMLKLNEQYKGYMVTEIDNTHIVFSNGENQITLKRGAKK